MIWIAEGRRRTTVDSDDETVDYDNQPFGRINGSPRCGISLHVFTTNKRRKKRDGKDTQYLIQG